MTLDEKYILSLIRLTFRELDLLMVDNIFDKMNETVFEVASRLIKSLQKKNTTLIVATTKESVANMFCKRKIYFKDGSIVDKL